MTRLLISTRAASDVLRLCEFLENTLPEAAAETAGLIAGALEILTQHPQVGRTVGCGLRELVISRGSTGYLARYSYDAEADAVSILAVRHQREARYQRN